MYQKSDWNDLLIAEVKKRPILYSKESQDHFDRHAKNQMWEEVFDMVVPFWNEMSIDERAVKGREIKGKWQNLRTCFRRALNDQEKGVIKFRKYVYFDRLRFLIDTDKDRETAAEIDPLQMEPKFSGKKNVDEIFNQSNRNLKKPKRENKSSFKLRLEEVSNEMPTEELSSISTDSVQNYFEESLSQPIRNSRKQQTDKISSAESLVEISKETSMEDIDEDKHFLLSLVPAFKKMTNQQKISTKVKYLRIIGEVLSDSVNTRGTKAKRRQPFDY